MSADNYSSYKKGLGDSFSSARSESQREELRRDRENLRGVRQETVDHTKFNKKIEVDRKKLKLRIGRPEAKKNYLILVDTSFSNDAIVRHFLQCGGFLLAPFGIMDISVSFGFIFFSDHKDDKPEQDIGFVAPSEQGESELTSSMSVIEVQDGDDVPEMIECSLMRAATELPLAGTDTHIILVTDSIAHGMGFKGTDYPCPRNNDWKEAVEAVRRTCSGFTVIGCSNSKKTPTIPDLQKKFFKDARDESENFIDLSSIADEGDRKRLVVNAVQFIVARDHGLEIVEALFSGLYAKLLKEGLRGQETDSNARDRISRFMKYVQVSESEQQGALARIFGDV